MNIIYICSAMAKQLNEELEKILKCPTEYAIQKFHSLIINGINNSEDINITVLSGLPISRKNNKKLFWKRRKINENGIEYIHVPFINLPILKQLLVSISMFIESFRWTVKNKNRCIICDAAYVSVTPIIMILSKLFKIKIIGIVADVYGYMTDRVEQDNKNYAKKFLGRLYRFVLENYSGYIFLTENMNKLINDKNKPYIIMEGLVDSNLLNEKDNKPYNKYTKKVCIYAGGLNKKYGIKSLVEAFEKANVHDSRLDLYGNGDLVEYLTNLKSKKVNYLGFKENSEILEEENKATLLINPRFSNEEYTKYSFPSKNMEYMATGTPLLTTKLPGMPKEYYKYVYLIEDETVEGMKKAIEKTLNIDSKELNKKGEEARKFVLNEKNNIIQGKKIIDWLQNI